MARPWLIWLPVPGMAVTGGCRSWKVAAGDELPLRGVALQVICEGSLEVVVSNAGLAQEPWVKFYRAAPLNTIPAGHEGDIDTGRRLRRACPVTRR